jgi:magnesium transporter
MLSLYWYDTQNRQLCQGVDPSEIPALLENPNGVLWANLFQPTESEVELLHDVFYFHPLCVEDCIHRQYVPKLEEFPNYLFLVIHGIQATQRKIQFDTVNLNLFLGKNFVVTVHWEPLQPIDFARDNLTRGTSAIHSGASALAHEILDATVDLYMPVLSNLDDHLLALEDLIERNPATDIVKDFFDLRRSILQIRRISLKEQEVFYWLSHRDIPFISHKDVLLFRDIYDHLVRVVELSESARDILSGILTIHLSLMSNRMNDIMRVLTVFSAILLPLTFIAGIYGMNFQNMPELRDPYGYYITLMVMGLITLAMLVFFRKKGWL